ncbi:hypothetical protein H4R34_001406 [Dimargaris verticillata]|uniref:Uncharacterized protein n=1 Tax=Dimargaris verticillata TaxID=2761393 RepID=A0A9W8EAY3_9FUNG|nr:hypothetical protein H4R34_001406 [Dimargaris verticillata]
MATPQRASRGSDLDTNAVDVTVLSEEECADLANLNLDSPVAIEDEEVGLVLPPAHSSDGNSSDEDDRLLDELEAILASRYRSDVWVKERDEFAAQCFAQQRQWASKSDTPWSSIAAPITGETLPPNPHQDPTYDSDSRYDYRRPRQVRRPPSKAARPSLSPDGERARQPGLTISEFEASSAPSPGADLGNHVTVDSYE